MHIKDLHTYEEFWDVIGGLEIEDQVSWVIGGATGGNCWGGTADIPVEAEEEPDDSLDELLSHVCPDLTFLQYRSLMKSEIYRYDKKERREYYGNYTVIRERTLDLELLYQKLREFYE